MYSYLTNKTLINLLLISFLTGCAAVAKHHFDERYGEAEVQDRMLHTNEVASTAESIAIPEYHTDVKPIFDKRCVVCHGCYDAPCQLKMSSHEAIDRGASKNTVYDGARIVSSDPTRMFEDALNTAAWREKDFFPVLNERVQTPEANLAASTLYRMLELKKQHPLPQETLLPESFDLGINRKQECTTIERFDQYASNFPLWGMPYGLPAIKPESFNTVKAWLEAGAKSLPPAPLSETLKTKVEKWEAFFNGNGLKQQLVSRYMYEHLYLANLYFPEASENARPQFFKLMRSYTPPGTEIKPIATRRPFDDPGDAPFFYRLRPVYSTTLDKTNMPYRLDSQRMDRWQSLFYETNYQVDSLPGYDPKVSANPFDAFEQLPVEARYKFMLDEAQYTISGFIKGPVCRGQIALNVIRDHFWVVFVDPDNEHMSDAAEFISQEKDFLRMPAEDGSDGLPVRRWLKYSRLQQEYNEARNKRINEMFPSNEDLNLDLIWDGNGHNANAALTVFRHFDSATVVKGHIGKQPLTTWVIGYTLLERIHYLLVAGFDVYGNVSHQLLTRLYMDFLRMEAESNFLSLLPTQTALSELERWNLDSLNEVKIYSELMQSRNDGTTMLQFTSDSPKSELLEMIQARFSKDVFETDPINRPNSDMDYAPEIAALQKIADMKGAQLTNLPEQMLIRVKKSPINDSEIYTLLNNVSHTNVSHIFREDKRILPHEQTLTVAKGIIGSYPNIMIDVEATKLSEFSEAFTAISNAQEYTELLDRYGVRRTSEHFWDFSDWVHNWYAQTHPIEAGYLDFNRLENR